MSVTAADEGRHPHSDDLHWRERLYFGFHDAGGGIGGMATIDVYPNQNRVQGFTTLFLDVQQVLFYYAENRLDARRTGLFSMNGIAYEMLSPLQQWRVRAAGAFNSVDPHQAAQGFRSLQRTVPASFDLTFEAIGPVYEFSPVLGLLTGAAQHYEQNGRVRGTATAGEKTLAVDGFGFRDHCWGVRDIAWSGHLVALSAQFGPQLTVSVARRMDEGEEVVGGHVFRHGTNAAVRELQVSVGPGPPGGIPQAARAEILTEVGEFLLLEGTVIAVMPILLDQEQGQLRWYECFTRFQCGQEHGYGILELTQFVEQAGALGGAL